MKMNKNFQTLYCASGLAGLTLAFTGTIAPAKLADSHETRFRVRVENISASDAIKAPEGKRQAVGISPGFWAIHKGANPIFSAGVYDAGKGLESQAEDGNPAALSENLKLSPSVSTSGIFNIPVGKSEPGPIPTGNAYEFSITAKPGDKLSMSMMFGHSNDWFFTSGTDGVALFDKSGKPISGDQTKKFSLWDAGTEEDEEPGVGMFQASRQSVPNTGPAEHEKIQMVSKRGFSFSSPAVNKTIRVTIVPES